MADTELGSSFKSAGSAGVFVLAAFCVGAVAAAPDNFP